MPDSPSKCPSEKNITFDHDVCGQISSVDLIRTTSRVYLQLGKTLRTTFVEMRWGGLRKKVLNARSVLLPPPAAAMLS
jgi:hypothetical protein